MECISRPRMDSNSVVIAGPRFDRAARVVGSVAAGKVSTVVDGKFCDLIVVVVSRDPRDLSRRDIATKNRHVVWGIRSVLNKIKRI